MKFWQTGLVPFKQVDRTAFSRTDLLVVLAMISMVGATVSIPVHLFRSKSRLLLCQENLSRIGSAIHRYAADHQDILPGATLSPLGESWWWYKEEVKGYMGLSGASSTNDRVFACPLDRGYTDPQPFWATARFDFASYVFNGVTLLGAPNIAGWKRASIAQPAKTLLVMEWSAHAPLSWHRSRTRNSNTPFYKDAQSVVAFVDGRVALTKMFYDGHTAAYLRDPITGYDYQYSGR